jgi:hypothetical protein
MPSPLRQTLTQNKNKSKQKMVDLTVDDNNEQKGTKTLTATLFPTKNYIKKDRRDSKNSSTFHKKSIQWKKCRKQTVQPAQPSKYIVRCATEGLTLLTTNGYFPNAPFLQSTLPTPALSTLL